MDSLKQVFCMKEGTGESSYNKTSYIQKQALLLSKSMKEKAIKEFYLKINSCPTSLWIIDLGCSTIELNKLSATYELIETVEKVCKQLGKKGPIEYQIALNDLPSNDFNTVFKSLPYFEDLLEQQMGADFGNCFVSAFPGSFYERLFPANSLHFVHSSYSLHWLSQVPRGIEENKGHIYIGRTSTQKVFKAYFDQFQNDFSTFLQCRSKEVIPGGVMLLTMTGKKTNDQYCKESSYFFEFLTSVLKDMASEGYIEEDKLNKFSMAYFEPSSTELEDLIQKEGSFSLDHIEVYDIKWITNNSDASDFSKCMQSVFEPLLISHFGNSIIDPLFERFTNLLSASSLAKEKGAFVTITMSLSKKGMNYY